jgi:hypothetical protein
MSATDEREVVLAFVRGERGWQDLALAGVSVSFMDDGCDCEGAGTVVVRPSVADIATGFTTHMSSREVDLRRWASVILAASTIIDLEALLGVVGRERRAHSRHRHGDAPPQQHGTGRP